jgi:hypothetical protein
MDTELDVITDLFWGIANRPLLWCPWIPALSRFALGRDDRLDRDNDSNQRNAVLAVGFGWHFWVPLPRARKKYFNTGTLSFFALNSHAAPELFCNAQRLGETEP